MATNDSASQTTTNSGEALVIGATEGAQAPSQAVATGDGFIVGVEPAARPGSVTQPPEAPQQGQTRPQSTGERTFSAQDIEEARGQEKNKLYGRIEAMDEELKNLRAEREAERAAKEAAEREAEEQARLKAEEEMDVRQLLETTRTEMAAEVANLRTQAELAQAMLEKEREMQQLEQYRQEALRSNADKIVPQLTDFVRGDSQAEIDASLQDAIVRSESLTRDVLAARQQAQQGMLGTRVTAPSGSGPMEEQQEQRQITPEDIRRMSPSEYAASRGALQVAGSRQFYSQRQ